MIKGLKLLALFPALLFLSLSVSGQVVTGTVTFTTTTTFIDPPPGFPPVFSSYPLVQFPIGGTFTGSFSYDASSLVQIAGGEYRALALTYPVFDNPMPSDPGYVYFSSLGGAPVGLSGDSYQGQIGGNVTSEFFICNTNCGTTNWQYVGVGESRNTYAEGTYALSIPSPVPEPESYKMIFAGLILVLVMGFRKQNIN